MQCALVGQAAELRTMCEKQSNELREAKEYSTRLEQDLQSQTLQCSKLRGSGLEDLDVSELQELISVHEQSLQIANDLLHQRGILPRTPPAQDAPPSQVVVGLGMSSGASAQLGPNGPQQQWPNGFRDNPINRPSMFRSGGESSGYARCERLAPYPGVPPRGSDLAGPMSGGSFHRSHSKLGFGSGIDDNCAMGLMRGGSDYGGTLYPPRPPPEDGYSNYHMSPPPAYEVHPHGAVHGTYLYPNRPPVGNWHGNRGSGGGGLPPESNGTVQREMLDRPLSGYVNGLFGSSSLTNGKRIW